MRDQGSDLSLAPERYRLRRPFLAAKFQLLLPSILI